MDAGCAGGIHCTGRPEQRPTSFLVDRAIAGFELRGCLLSLELWLQTTSGSCGMKLALLNLQWLAVAALVLAGSFGAMTIVVHHHREAALAARVRDAQRTIEILTPKVAADARFQNVRVTFATGPGVYLVGPVACGDDLEALRHLVERTRVPVPAHLAVGVGTNWGSPQSGAGGGQPSGSDTNRPSAADGPGR